MTLDDVYDELLPVVSDAGARIGVPIECEEFFDRVVREFSGSKEELIEYVRANVSVWFRSAANEPAWIQDADWQFYDGKPMIFLGQVNVPVSAGLFHDDATVFVFLSESGITRTVIQVA